MTIYALEQEKEVVVSGILGKKSCETSRGGFDSILFRLLHCVTESLATPQYHPLTV